ncbi:MAG: nucleotide pyrophosphohydrolase [Lachnospiraceae bacterium]|nr:nucleotide pyrophosphohydrolase [Lachnospiraceae bacterium]
MYTFDDLKTIMTRLRGKDGCPWDRAQTHESLKRYLVEECGEVLEAIDNQDTENLCEELGDVLYQIMIHSEIEKEKGSFCVDDVVDGICKKMVRRHPRVFGGADMSAEASWEEIKKKEQEARSRGRGDGI